MASINIEITQTPDAQALAAIHASCFDRGWDARAISDMLATGGTIAAVARGDVETRGFGMARVIKDEAEILTLAVPRHSRKRGIGARITSAMCEYARAQGATTVFLEVRQSNEAAQSLYTKAGFAPLSRRRLYYQGGDGSLEDAIIMRRTF